MKSKELKFILEEGEGYKIEFKESLTNLDKEISAFANASGGRIFLGISDDNKVKGIKKTNNLKSKLQDIANNLDPSVNIKIEEFNEILIINVGEGKNKPYRCSSGFYLRVGPNSQKMKTENIKDLIFSQGKIKFDEIVNRNFDFNDLDKEALKDYLKRAGISVSENIKSTLYNLGVSEEKGKITNAGVLFFSKKPKKYFINSYVTCARYSGTKKVDVIDRIDIESNIVKQVEESIKFIRRNTRTSYKIKGIEREEIPEYPIEALREAIVNAIMHRDYFEKGANVQIDIFDDRIEISNIGSLIPPLEKSNLGRIAVRRNPLIADLFFRIKFVEKMGTGIKRIIKECERQGNVKFTMDVDGFFISTFKLVSKIVPKDVPEIVPKDVPEKREKTIISLINKNSKISIEDLAKLLDVNAKTIKRDLDKLKENKVIKRIGPAKGGHWKLINNQNVPKDVPKDVPEKREKTIISLINKNSKISIEELANILDVNAKTIKRDLDKLKENRLLKRIGSAKGGHWKIIKQ